MTEEILEQPKAVVTGAGAQPAWLEKAQAQWKIYAVIALVIVGAIGGIWWYVQQAEEKNTEAATQLSRIRSTFDQGLFEQALTADGVAPVGDNKVMGLLEISETYKGTDAGAVAALMAGNALANLGRYEEARVQFELAGNNGSIVAQVGSIQGLAACLEAEGKWSEAAAMYEKAALKAQDTGLEAGATFLAALCYEKSGNTSKAGELYMVVAKKFETSAAASDAKAGLARLGMAID